MTIRQTIARCLSILAIVGMLAVQTTGPAASNGVVPSAGDDASAVMVMDGVPMVMAVAGHGPGHEKVPPDCGRGCPWAAFCTASCAGPAGTPGLASIEWRALRAGVLQDDATVDPWSDGPPSRPPRA